MDTTYNGWKNYETWNGVNFAQMITDVKLDSTDKGYKYELVE